MNLGLLHYDGASQVGGCPQTEESGGSLDIKEQCDECSVAAGPGG